MPIYVYKNLATGDTFEIKQSMKDSALKVHPESGDPVKRLIQPVGIAFKGSGFYVNDSRSSMEKSKKLAKKSNAKTDSSVKKEQGKAVKKESNTSVKKETKTKKQSNAA